ncbi:MAG: DUF397 domain-containing protein [Nocardiopsis sp. BM-2018]|nr:MAG: DUF397 domain-containing protein [Nocardiopsis sp. BM-2018]
MDDYAPRWFKSSHSSLEHECLEVAVTDPVWRKSSHSSMENGNCVEASLTGSVTVLFRDTQNREAAVLAVPAREWAGTVCLVSGRRG